MVSAKMLKGIKSSFIVCLVVFFVFSLVVTSMGSQEYLSLTGTGNSMYPTICDRDTIVVMMCQNGSMIKAGDRDSSELGDIIVYGAIAAQAYMPNPEVMWIAHRVVQKYLKGETWWFRTKGDNNPEPDPWEVPEYWLLGIVVQIDHEAAVPQTSRAATPTDPTAQPTVFQWTTEDSIVNVISAATMLVAIVRALRQAKQYRMLKKVGILSCSGCQYFNVRITYRLVRTDGRLRIHKGIDFTKGSCRANPISITNASVQWCMSYRPRSPGVIPVTERTSELEG